MVLLLAGISTAREHENLSTNILTPGGQPPVKGLYYTLGYGSSDTIKSYDIDGNRNPNGALVNSNAVSNYFIWVPGWKLWGANFAMRAAIPFVRMDMSRAGTREITTGMADPMIIPASLNWNFSRANLMAEMSFFVPVGQYSTSKTMANVGQDHWTISPRIGGTVYFDQAKTFTLSALMAYEYNLENGERKIEQGDQLWMQFGLAKRFGPVQAGLYGYASWKLQEDKGDDVNPFNPMHDKDTVYAIGPEMNVKINSTTVTMKYLHEFGAENRGTANTFRLSLGWKFF